MRVHSEIAAVVDVAQRGELLFHPIQPLGRGNGEIAVERGAIVEKQAVVIPQRLYGS